MHSFSERLPACVRTEKLCESVNASPRERLRSHP